MERMRQLIHDIRRRSLQANFAVAAFGIILAARTESPGGVGRTSVSDGIGGSGGFSPWLSGRPR